MRNGSLPPGKVAFDFAGIYRPGERLPVPFRERVAP